MAIHLPNILPNILIEYFKYNELLAVAFRHLSVLINLYFTNISSLHCTYQYRFEFRYFSNNNNNVIYKFQAIQWKPTDFQDFQEEKAKESKYLFLMFLPFYKIFYYFITIVWLNPLIINDEILRL